jgi:hypothetical protein
MAPRKSSPKRSSPRRSRKSPMVDIEPSAEILKVMTWISALFILCAVAGLIAWIYYVDKANNFLGNSTNQTTLDTIDVCFQSFVASFLLYVVVRHHYNTRK